MATNIVNLATGQAGYQIPGSPLPAGWSWGTPSGAATTPQSTAGGNPGSPYVTSGGTTPTSYYGNTKRNSDWEGTALQEENQISQAAGQSGMISSNFLSTVAADPSIVGFYVNALAYGGYTIGDVVNDMKRRELASQGNTQAQNLKIIDPEVNRTSYQSTAEGQQSVSKASQIIPTFNMQGLLNPDILKYGTNMPDDLFKTLVPILDNTSQQFKDAVASIKSAYYDLANAQLQANTEQEKAVADYNYSQFKDQLEQKYGIQLSNDATKAWNQINNLEDTFNTRGLSGSGLQNNAIDQTLRDTRVQDQRMRDSKLNEADSTKASYYRSSASAAEIAALTPEEKQKYGLTPSAAVASQYDLATLKAKYPDQTDAQLQAYRNAVLDENGNYRSTLYSNYYKSVATNNTSKDTLAKTTVEQDALNKEAAAYKAYDTSQTLNVQPSKTGTTGNNTGTTTSTPGTLENTAANAVPPASSGATKTSAPSGWSQSAWDQQQADEAKLFGTSNTAKNNPNQ